LKCLNKEEKFMAIVISILTTDKKKDKFDNMNNDKMNKDKEDKVKKMKEYLKKRFVYMKNNKKRKKKKEEIINEPE